MSTSTTTNTSTGPNPNTEPAPTKTIPTWVFSAFVVVALALRIIEAVRKSFWLDELHTLYHASGATVQEVLDRLVPDFHAPVFFLVMHPLQFLDPHWQRSVPLVTGLATLFIMRAFCRQAGIGKWGFVAAISALCFLPFQIRYGVELRPYAWLQIINMLLIWASFTTKASATTRSVVFFLALGIGLNTHYLVALAMPAILAARLLVRVPGALGFRRLLLLSILGSLTFLPWALHSEKWLVSEPQDAVVSGVERKGPSASNLLPDVIATLPRMLCPTIDNLGEPVAQIVRPMIMVLMGLGLLLLPLAFWRLLRRDDPAQALRAFLLAGLLLTALLLLSSVVVWKRVAIQYYSAVAWLWPLWFALGVDALKPRWLRATIAIAICATCLAAGTAHVLGDSTEDLRRAVEVAQELGGPDAIYTGGMEQPWYFPQGHAFVAYPGPLDVREPEDVSPANGRDQRRPVVMVTRKFRYPIDLKWCPPGSRWRNVIEGRHLAEKRVIDGRVMVLLYLAN